MLLTQKDRGRLILSLLHKSDERNCFDELIEIETHSGKSGRLRINIY